MENKKPTISKKDENGNWVVVKEIEKGENIIGEIDKLFKKNYQIHAVLVPNWMSIITFNDSPNVPCLDFMGENVIEDVEIYLEWEKKKEKKKLNSPEEFIKEVNNFIKYYNKKSKRKKDLIKLKDFTFGK